MPDLTSAQMKKILAEGKSGVMVDGKIITDPKNVPNDDQLAALRAANGKKSADRLARQRAMVA